MGYGTHLSAPSGYDGFGTFVRVNRIIGGYRQVEVTYFVFISNVMYTARSSLIVRQPNRSADIYAPTCRA